MHDFPLHMAPEIFEDEITEKCDVWSCGIIFYYLLIGKPFDCRSEDEFELIIKDGGLLSKFEKITPKSKEFLKKILNYNPKKRPTAEEALQDEWIKFTLNKTTADIDKCFSQKLLENMRNFITTDKIQQATISYIMHHIYNSNELDELKKVFMILDKSGDGRLTSKEIKEGFQQILGNSLQNEEFDKIIAIVDHDKNGYIEFEEFLSDSINLRNVISEDNLRKAFYCFDKNKDGTLSIEELKGILKTSDVVVINNLFKQLDLNKSGSIDFHEFCTLMKSLFNNSSNYSNNFEISKNGRNTFIELRKNINKK